MVQGMFCGTRETGLPSIASLLATPTGTPLEDHTGTSPVTNGLR